MRSRRARLLVLNQYYATAEASGELLRQLCEDLADEFDIEVIAAESASKAPILPPGIRGRFVKASRFSRATPAGRAANYASFTLGSVVALARARRPDAVLCQTDPPFIGVLGLAAARFRRGRLVVIMQDIHPEVGEITGGLRSRLVIAILREAQRLVVRYADHLVAIGYAMSERLIERGAQLRRLSVIPNWVDPEIVFPAPRVNVFGHEHDLVNRPVLMHAGNIGRLQSLETVIEAGRALPDIDIVFLGQGSNQQALADIVARSRIQNVRMIPFQGRGTICKALGSADFHLVSLLPGLAGFLEPSKLYSVLAAGRPVIAATDPKSEAARLVRESDCGIVVRPSDPKALVDGLRALLALPLAERQAMGARGANLAITDCSRGKATESYRLLLRGLTTA